MINAFPQLWPAASEPEIVQPTYRAVTIQAFTLTNESHATSDIVGELPLENSLPVSIALPFLQAVTNPDRSYQIAIRYIDDNGDVYRYILFDGNEAFQLQYTPYDGQTIRPNAILEIWANPADTVIASSDDIVFYLNTISPYGISNPSPCGCTGVVQGTGTFGSSASDNPPSGGQTVTVVVTQSADAEFETVAEMLASPSRSWTRCVCFNWTAGDEQITEWFFVTGRTMTPNGDTILLMNDAGGYAVRTPQA